MKVSPLGQTCGYMDKTHLAGVSKNHDHFITLWKVKMKINNIYDVIHNNLCISCGACTCVAPNKKIIMKEDKKRGIYIPLNIDNLSQSELDLAFKVCPGKGVPIKRYLPPSVTHWLIISQFEVGQYLEPCASSISFLVFAI